MATANMSFDFLGQINEIREKIQNNFKRSHEALDLREDFLLSRIGEIEREYNIKTQRMHKHVENLDINKSCASETLTSNTLQDTNENIHSAIDSKVIKLKADTDSFIEFEWNDQWEADIKELGRICYVERPNKSHAAPDYKAKQQPTTYRCKNPWFSKGPSELSWPSGLSVDMSTGNVYIADRNNNRVQVFDLNGEYSSMFCGKMNGPRGISISKDKVFVTQWGSHSINMYEMEGKLIKSVGSKGDGEAQFEYPHGIDVSDRNMNVYVCDTNNHRVQILTEELKFHSMLGIDLLKYPRDVKATRDRVFVLDESDPCITVFDSDHVLTSRVIPRGNGKQARNPYSFYVDRNYKIIMSDYSNHCVYVFTQEGKLIHKFGKQGQDVGEFSHPYGIALDDTGRIVVVCEKKTNCLQFF